MVNISNKIYEHIQFTLETQINNKINLLDNIVSLLNNKFEFNIYRKPTKSGSIIHYDLTINISHKKLH